MNELIQKAAVICFIGWSVYFGVLSVIQTIKYAAQTNQDDKIIGARRSTIFLSISAISFFLAAEIYKLNVICALFLPIFIGLFWLNYLIYIKVNESLKR